MDGGAIFLQITDGFAQVEVKLFERLENSLLSLEKKIHELVKMEYHHNVQLRRLKKSERMACQLILKIEENSY